ncbi:MAG: Trm112 family protein, partial [Thaumarchaeota archaeon]|nr:Trm112 family protein [Nitrososphaerota archaeon]
MKTNLVSQLACPVCHTEFTIKNVKKIKDEIKEGTLICSNKHKFTVSNGVPRFVIDTTKDFVRTEDAFSAKWRHHHENHHAKDWIEFQTKWFLERYEWESLKKFNDFLNTKTKILDAGT